MYSKTRGPKGQNHAGPHFRSVRLSRVTGARTLAEPRDAFLPRAGFLQGLTPEELQSLADRTGYQPAYVRGQPEPHAIFIPCL
jgi:hypothetical protein